MSHGLRILIQNVGILVHRKKHEMGLSQSLFHAFFYKNYHFVDYNRNVCFLERRCNQLGMSMIAEGVETVEQADFLKDIDCSEMQGYYFYKPMPVHEFEKIIE